MLGILGGDERCPIARSLDVLGEKWTLLVVRDALAGATRFGQFRDHLGIPREVLTGRLATLVEGGVMERVGYKPEGGRSRDEYVLTEAGRELSLVLLAMGNWADRHRPSELTSDLRFVDSADGSDVAAAAAGADSGRVVPVERVVVERRAT
jgi:DNA-binding HxlR family transcriptional regulator